MSTLMYFYSNMSLFDKSFAVVGIVIPGACLLAQQAMTAAKTIISRAKDKQYF